MRAEEKKEAGEVVENEVFVRMWHRKNQDNPNSLQNKQRMEEDSLQRKRLVNEGHQMEWALIMLVSQAKGVRRQQDMIKLQGTILVPVEVLMKD